MRPRLLLAVFDFRHQHGFFCLFRFGALGLGTSGVVTSRSSGFDSCFQVGVVGAAIGGSIGAAVRSIGALARLRARERAQLAGEHAHDRDRDPAADAERRGSGSLRNLRGPPGRISPLYTQHFTPITP
jgi:hypothetical protein